MKLGDVLRVHPYGGPLTPLSHSVDRDISNHVLAALHLSSLRAVKPDLLLGLTRLAIRIAYSEASEQLPNDVYRYISTRMEPPLYEISHGECLGVSKFIRRTGGGIREEHALMCIGNPC